MSIRYHIPATDGGANATVAAPLPAQASTTTGDAGRDGNTAITLDEGDAAPLPVSAFARTVLV
jgi:hypothetical protein